MEVHHHSHTSRKKWTHYFWEFLMLFLAVFCGFLAEYQLEHKIEKDREKQFMVSLVQDIKKDISQADSLILQNSLSQNLCDSLLKLLTTKEINSNSYPAYSLWYSINGFIDFIPNDGTMQQLKNSGALRLVRKREVVSKLLDYNRVLELTKIHQTAMNSYLFQPSKKSELFDAPRLAIETDRVNIPLLSSDRKLLSWCYEYIISWKNLIGALNIYLESTKTRGNILLESIRKEYSLK